MLRKKSYPGKLKVKRAEYELLLTHAISDPKDDVLGYCMTSDKDKDVKVIAVLNSLRPKRMFEIMLHEALHAIEHEYKLNIPHDVIEELERPLAKFLFDNFDIEFKRRK